MSAADLLEARRVGQEIARLHRHIRHLRKRGRLSEADARLATFATDRVIVVPSGTFRQLTTLLDDAERLRIAPVHP